MSYGKAFNENVHGSLANAPRGFPIQGYHVSYSLDTGSVFLRNLKGCLPPSSDGSWDKESSVSS